MKIFITLLILGIAFNEADSAENEENGENYQENIVTEIDGSSEFPAIERRQSSDSENSPEELAEDKPAEIGGSSEFRQSSDSENSPEELAELSEDEPQHRFQNDNSKMPIFKPFLTYKPNALQPFSIHLDRDGTYCHPYKYEIESFRAPPTQIREGDCYYPVDDFPFLYVGTEEQLDVMMRELVEEDVVGVHSNHHGKLSHSGFTCLIQISSREKDYVIDAVALRKRLTILNEIFTDPEVLKIFHDASGEVKWLQKDFSVYLVNVFDTYVAAKSLDFPKKGMRSILANVCDVLRNRNFRNYDWRQRPLPRQALEYVRTNTRYLPFIYDNMRNMLLDARKKGNPTMNLLNIYCKTRTICLRKYESKQNNSTKQILTNLMEWRDKKAREVPGYVLPIGAVHRITKRLPENENMLLRTIGGNNRAKNFARKYKDEIFAIIWKAGNSSNADDRTVDDNDHETR